MARTAKLKVFRTPIGFHDAYVAAPSRKAALDAWGSDHDLFARGVAEQVTDAALMRDPLASPGTVIKRLRGSADEQFAALAPDKPKPAGRKSAKATPPRPRPPHPDRASLDRAEAALAAAEERHARERRELAADEAKLARRRHALEQAQDKERAALHDVQAQARDAYARALDQWRKS